MPEGCNGAGDGFSCIIYCYSLVNDFQDEEL
jgi:hypothetical protein